MLLFLWELFLSNFYFFTCICKLCLSEAKTNTLENITWPAGKKQITFFEWPAQFLFFLTKLVNAIPARLTNFCESIFFFLFFSFFFKLFGWELIIVCIFLFTGSWAYIRGEGLFVGECAYKQTFTVGKLSVGRRPKKMSCTVTKSGVDTNRAIGERVFHMVLFGSLSVRSFSLGKSSHSS